MRCNLRKLTLPALLMLFVFFFCIPVPAPCAESSTVEPDAFTEIFEHIQGRHISEPAPGTLMRGAIEGLIYSLNDPYTEYIPPAELEDFKESLDGEYVGVGIQLQPGERYPIVIDTIENSPARDAGIKPGDLVIEVNGADISRESLGELVQKIRGPEGTIVRLTIRREGIADFETVLSRANVCLSTVSGKILNDDTGYIKINTFGMHTTGEFKKILFDLRQQGAKKLILDIRNNPGGLLQAAVEISSIFFEPGKVVVSAVDVNGRYQEYLSEGEPIGKGMPLVVLVDQNSASAAEILAGALQDYGAAILVGGRTYGKGTVQEVIPLKSGGVLKVTSARYHTPKGGVIDGIGLCPDIQVFTPNLHVAVAQRYLDQIEKCTVVFEDGNPGVLVNGSEVQLGQGVVQHMGVTYLPLRFILEALGYCVDWQAGDGSIKITGRNPEAIVYPESGRVIVNGRVLSEAESLFFKNGSAYVPVSFLNLLDINVVFDGSNITVKK